MVMNMERSLRPMQRLQWRLTVSFLLVTAIATLSFVLATAIVTYSTLKPYTSSPPVFGNAKLAGASLQQIAPMIDVVPYLGPGSLDQHFLTARLSSLIQPPPAKSKTSGAFLSSFNTL